MICYKATFLWSRSIGRAVSGALQKAWDALSTYYGQEPQRAEQVGISRNIRALCAAFVFVEFWRCWILWTMSRSILAQLVIGVQPARSWKCLWNHHLNHVVTEQTQTIQHISVCQVVFRTPHLEFGRNAPCSCNPYAFVWATWMVENSRLAIRFWYRFLSEDSWIVPSNNPLRREPASRWIFQDKSFGEEYGHAVDEGSTCGLTWPCVTVFGNIVTCVTCHTVFQTLQWRRPEGFPGIPLAWFWCNLQNSSGLVFPWCFSNWNWRRNGNRFFFFRLKDLRSLQIPIPQKVIESRRGSRLISAGDGWSLNWSTSSLSQVWFRGLRQSQRDLQRDKSWRIHVAIAKSANACPYFILFQHWLIHSDAYSTCWSFFW